MKTSNGFTLIEVIVVIMVVAILVAIAMPSYLSTMQSTQVRKTTDLLVQSIDLVKSEALNKNTDTYLSVQSGDICLSTTAVASAGHTCDIRLESIVNNVAISLSNASGPVTEIRFSHIYGTPSPISVNFSISNSSSTQTASINILGIVSVGVQS